MNIQHQTMVVTKVATTMVPMTVEILVKLTNWTRCLVILSTNVLQHLIEVCMTVKH